MNKNYLKTTWKHEEELAHVHGWDFSHINGRYREESKSTLLNAVSKAFPYLHRNYWRICLACHGTRSAPSKPASSIPQRNWHLFSVLPWIKSLKICSISNHEKMPEENDFTNNLKKSCEQR